MNVENLLKATQAKLTEFRLERAASASGLAPDFNVFNLLNPGEVALSNVLSDFLNPEGTHAQGRKFLDSFINHFELYDLVGGREVNWIKNEAPTDAISQSGRRIDILIEFSGSIKGQNLAVAIENKPWASDQDRQAKDYLEHLKKRYPTGYALIYLPGEEGRHPSEHSINKDDLKRALECKTIYLSSYNKIALWLSACKATCEAEKVINFIKSFEHYIHQKFMGISDMTERKILLDEVSADAVSIQTAFEIIHAKSEIESLLYKKLAADLVNKIEVEGKPWRLHGSLDKKLYIQLSEGDLFTVGFALDENKLSFGIFNYQGVGDRLPPVEDIMSKKFGGNKQKEPGKAQWIWWSHVDSYGSNWSNTSKPWVDIQNGVMATLIYDKVNGVAKLLAEEKLLPELQRYNIELKK